jgi:hypothetical protein
VWAGSSFCARKGGREPLSQIGQVFDERALLFEQPFGLVMLLMQALAFRLKEAAIFATEREALDRAGELPQEAPNGRLGDAAVVVGAGFIAQGVEIVRRFVAKDEERLVVAAGAKGFDQFDRVDAFGVMPDDNGVEYFIAQSS